MLALLFGLLSPTAFATTSPLDSAYCSCADASATCDFETDAKTGSRYLALKTGCMMATGFPLTANPSVRFQVFTLDPIPHAQDFRFKIHSTDPSDPYLANSHPVSFSRVNGVFSALTAPMSTNGAHSARVNIENSQPQDLRITDIREVTSRVTPPPKVGSLVYATHQTQFVADSGYSHTELWTALPLDIASQVPLGLHVSIKPHSIVDKIRYTRDPIGNWGAVITLGDVPVGTNFRIEWESTVLSRNVNETERPRVYAAKTDPAMWTSPSQAVESHDPAISAVAATLGTGLTQPLEKMKAAIGWTSQNITYGGAGPYDASTAYAGHLTTCTGFANLAAAIGRDMSVPTRVMANILVGLTQQVHSINEFYLGKSLGWRRVEPQSTMPTVWEDYGVMLRIVEPDDENEVGAPTYWQHTGIPFKTFDTPLTSPGAFASSMYASANSATPPTSPRQKVFFPDCPMPGSCDNRAEHWIDLRGDRADMIALFARARRLWRRDVRSYMSRGELDPGVQSVRLQSRQIKRLDDLRSFLDAIE